MVPLLNKIFTKNKYFFLHNFVCYFSTRLLFSRSLSLDFPLYLISILIKHEMNENNNPSGEHARPLITIAKLKQLFLLSLVYFLFFYFLNKNNIPAKNHTLIFFCKSHFAIWATMLVLIVDWKL